MAIFFPFFSWSFTRLQPPSPEFQISGFALELSQFRLLRMVRLVRVLRLLRVVRFCSDLRIMVNGILGCGVTGFGRFWVERRGNGWSHTTYIYIYIYYPDYFINHESKDSKKKAPTRIQWDVRFFSWLIWLI